MDSYQCYLLETFNEQTIHIAEHPCDDEGCDYVNPAEDRTIFDVRRADTGEVIAAAVSNIPGAAVLQPGAMWWSDGSDGYYPQGPDDWGDRTPEEQEDLKKRVRDLPELYQTVRNPQAYPAAVLPSGLPVRAPSFQFADGPQLHVVTPGGVWCVTSRASNCTMPYDYEHRCWVIHGEPPNVTVDKEGVTCSAGAGSIRCGDYHGFLRDGWLVP